MLLEGDTAKIGITDYAQSTLGDISTLELPKIGQKLEADSTFGSVESVKTVSDLYSPVSGEVIEINEQVVAHPDLLNQDPHNNWIIKVAVKGGKVGQTMSSADYEKLVG